MKTYRHETGDGYMWSPKRQQENCALALLFLTQFTSNDLADIGFG